MKRIMTIALWFLGAMLFLRFLFVPLLPFLLALGLCALLEPWVQRLCRAIHVKRAFAAVVVTTIMLLVLGGGLLLLSLRLVKELAEWTNLLPQAINAFPALWHGVAHEVGGWYSACPSFLRPVLENMAAALEKSTPTLAGKLGGFLVEKLSALAAALPGIALFCVTTVLALYFTAVNYSAILAFLKRQLPASWQLRCRRAAQCCRRAILKWLRSELSLILVTFFIMLLGFRWLGLDFALLAACFIALVDALPVLGAGIILIPWSLFSFLVGNTGQGTSLLILYVTSLLVHTLLEPKLLAGQGNLPPITVLLAMYLGHSFLGISGMILLPALLLILKQLQDAEVIQIWR